MYQAKLEQKLFKDVVTTLNTLYDKSKELGSIDFTVVRGYVSEEMRSAKKLDYEAMKQSVLGKSIDYLSEKKSEPEIYVGVEIISNSADNKEKSQLEASFGCSCYGDFCSNDYSEICSCVGNNCISDYCCCTCACIIT